MTALPPLDIGLISVDATAAVSRPKRLDKSAMYALSAEAKMDDWKFKVEFRKVAHRTQDGKWSEDENFLALVRTDKRWTLSVMSRRYAMVHHDTVMQGAIAAIGHAPEAVFVERQGQRMWARFALDVPAVEVGRGDPVNPVVLIGNSYDGTRAITVASGAIRVLCSNGLYIGQLKEEVTRRHIGQLSGVEVLIKDMVGHAADHFIHATERWKKWAVVPIEKKAGVEMLKIVDIPVSYKRAITDGWENLAEGTPRTAWTLYNEATRVFTHFGEQESTDFRNRMVVRIDKALTKVCAST